MSKSTPAMRALRYLQIVDSERDRVAMLQRMSERERNALAAALGVKKSGVTDIYGLSFIINGRYPTSGRKALRGK